MDQKDHIIDQKGLKMCEKQQKIDPDRKNLGEAVRKLFCL